MTQRTRLPFRADQVGSLLRSVPVKEARARRAANEITPAELRAVEDAEIAKLNRELGVTVLLATHAADVAALARRTLRMRDGRLVEAPAPITSAARV